MLTYDGRAVVHNPLPTYSTTADTGTTANGQAFSVITPDDGPGYAGVIIIHGILGSGAGILTDPIAGRAANRLAQVGFPVIAGNMFNAPPPYAGAGDGWGNDLSESCMDDLYTELVTNYGADSEAGVAIIGVSAGAPPGLYWASRNPSLTLCFASLAGVVYTDHTHEDHAGLAASINLAFGGDSGSSAGWDAAQPTRDPFAIATAGGLDGLRARLWQGDADELIRPQDVTDFADLIDAEVTWWAGNHAGYTATNPWQIANFVIDSYPATAGTRTIVT